MYSYLIEEKVLTSDSKKLLKIKEEILKDSGDYYADIITEEGEINFSAWDGAKLKDYWYNETVTTLNKIAPYTNGYVIFRAEDGIFFKLTFEDGGVFIQEQAAPDLEKIFSKIKKGELK